VCTHIAVCHAVPLGSSGVPLGSLGVPTGSRSLEGLQDISAFVVDDEDLQVIREVAANGHADGRQSGRWAGDCGAGMNVDCLQLSMTEQAGLGRSTLP